MKKLIALLLVLMLGITILAGCGGNASLSGKYVLKSMVSDGETIDMAEYMQEFKELYEELGEEFKESDFESYLEFSGSNVTVSLVGMAGKGTYKLDGKNIEITADGETLKGTIDGNKITLDYGEGSLMTYEKK